MCFVAPKLKSPRTSAWASLAHSKSNDVLFCNRFVNGSPGVRSSSRPQLSMEVEIARFGSKYGSAPLRVQNWSHNHIIPSWAWKGTLGNDVCFPQNHIIQGNPFHMYLCKTQKWNSIWTSCLGCVRCEFEISAQKHSAQRRKDRKTEKG